MKTLPGSRWLALAVFVGAVCSAEPYRLEVPRGLDEFFPIPEDNPLTTGKVELGRRLFFDRRLSRDRTLSCASCHVPSEGFADGKAVATGVEGRVGRRNVPSLFNRAYRRSFFWDGRETSLERQVLRPIEDPNEMDLALSDLEKRLREIIPTALGDRTIGGTASTVHDLDRAEPVPPQNVQGVGDNALHREAASENKDFAAKSYRDQFREVFGQPPSAQYIGQALASYVRVLFSADSAFDRFQAGEAAAMSEAAQRGLKLFRGKGNCTACHSGPLQSDEEFHNTGVGWAQEPLDLGRFEVTQREPDRGRFKTPSLRDVGQTAPYMHNGSLAILEEVIDFYSRGGNPNPNLDREIRPLNFTDGEKADLVTFLKVLSRSP